MGARSINNIVDITNYVLLETGQPLHAFDAKKLTEIALLFDKLMRVKKIITLDQVERTLKMMTWSSLTRKNLLSSLVSWVAKTQR